MTCPPLRGGTPAFIMGPGHSKTQVTRKYRWGSLSIHASLEKPVTHSRFTTIPNIFTLFAILTSLISGAVTFTPVHAAALVVNNNGDTVVGGDGKCTLREA